MVEKHIKTLLYDHDCVIIPDFGGLITRYVSVKINPVKHALSPPSKRIAFNEKLTLNDGLLISTIAYRNGISKTEAGRLVADFVYQAKNSLEEEQRFELRDIGIFRYNAERRLEFEYVEADNLLEASFGLPELTARPVRAEEPAVLRTLLKEKEHVPVNTKLPFTKRLKKFYNVAAALAFTGLSVTALYFLSLQTNYNLSSLNPIASVAGVHTSSEEVSAERYNSGYVPVSEEERAITYQSILPGKEAALDTIQDFNGATQTVSEILSPDSAAHTLAATAKVGTGAVAKTETAPVVEEVKQPVLTVEKKTGRFYIISGGYARLENARDSRNSILKEGYDAKVILPLRGSRLFRVSVADFATEEEAKQAARNYRKSFGETIWVLNN